MYYKIVTAFLWPRSIHFVYKKILGTPQVGWAEGLEFFTLKTEGTL